MFRDFSKQPSYQGYVIILYVLQYYINRYVQVPPSLHNNIRTDAHTYSCALSVRALYVHASEGPYLYP